MSIRPAGVPLTHLERLERVYPAYIDYIDRLCGMDWPSLNREQARMAQMGPKAGSMVSQCVCLSVFKVSGSKHFVINEELVWLLGHTTPSVTYDEIFIPFSLFYFSFVGLDLEVFGQQLDGAYIVHIDPGAVYGEKNISTLNIQFWLTCGLEIIILRHDLNPLMPETSHGWTSETLHGDGFPKADQEKAINLILNAILYISTPNAVRHKPSELLSHKQRQTAEKSAKKKRQLERLDHNTIVLGPRTPSFSRSPHQGGNVRAHLRRGHWRKQWVGTRQDELGNRRPGERQVPVWVMPAWVSGTDEPTKKTTYISL